MKCRNNIFEMFHWFQLLSS